ncbi:MAG TPA: adenylate/guanylate cyclase domain-containing protein [Spirochaetota bacterium]|nr:adenylate/guanylate cyclase domain-containing protein [Spirochaetota bacterium]
MTTEGKDFKKQFGFFSRLKIRSKLISMISIIIIASMGIMIFLATIFFKKDNEVRIKESNLTISQVVASKTESDFTALVEKINLMGTTILQEFKTAEQKNLFTSLFFSNDRDFLYVGICERGKDDVLHVTKKLSNDKFFADNNIDQALMEQVTADNSHKFVKSFNDESVVHNVSERFTFPVMAVSFPFQRDASDRVVSVLVGYIKLNRVLKAFVKNGITDTFMVNSEGDVIAHPDSNLIMSHANLANLPIVERMMKSKSDNEQTRYRDDAGVYYLGSFKKIGFSGIGIISTVPEGLAMQEVYNIQRRNIIITIIILNIAILIVYFFSKSLSGPLTKLVDATKEIEQGNFKVSIRPTTGDEIGILTDSFVEMGRGLEEREKMKDAFGKFVNKEIAEQVLKGTIKLGGERKVATVFFSDIRSFTAISEKLEPEEVVEFLNDYMTRMVDCINKTNGVVDKYIGDAVMAVWGAPVSHGNDTENSINGALMMRKALIEFNKGRGGDRKPIIKIGCGINTGPVLAGQIGSNERMEYTVIGDTVNLASRIESLNKPFGTDVLISHDTYIQIKNIFRVEPMQKIKVKGKSEPQQIYAVLGRIDDPSSPRTLDEMRRIVGIEMKGKPDEHAGDEGEVKYEILDE